MSRSAASSVPIEQVASQPYGFHQCGSALPEPGADRGHVGQQTGVGQPEVGHLRQCCDTRLTGQVVDVGAGEAQDGLTPVIMTL